MRRSNGFVTRMLGRFAMLAGAPRAVGPAVGVLHEGETEPIHPDTRFEGADINGKAVLLTGVGLILSLWVIVVLMYPLFAYFTGARAQTSPPPIQAAAGGTPLPPEPRLQADPRRDLTDFRKYEDGELNGYHWVNRANGTVSIPIDEAMRIVASQGIPPQTAPPNITYFQPEEGTRETGFAGKVEPR